MKFYEDETSPMAVNRPKGYWQELLASKGASTICYRYGKVRAAFDDGMMIGCLRFLIHSLTLALMLPIALPYALLEPCVKYLWNGLKETWKGRSSPKSAENGLDETNVDLIDFLVLIIVMSLYFILLLACSVIVFPFWLLYFVYRFLEELCSYQIVQIIIRIFVVVYILYLVWRLIYSFIGEPMRSWNPRRLYEDYRHNLHEKSTRISLETVETTAGNVMPKGQG